MLASFLYINTLVVGECVLRESDIRIMSSLTGQGVVANLGGMPGPNGDYNKRKGTDSGLLDFWGGKRARNDLLPAGRFNESGAGGPTQVLSNGSNSREEMARNLSTNQTEYILYINIPRFIVPVKLPSGCDSSQNPTMSLKKSVVAGDVIFHLRYNNYMINQNSATDAWVKNSGGSQLCFSINLQTVNFILVHLQRVMLIAEQIMLTSGVGDTCQGIGTLVGLRNAGDAFVSSGSFEPRFKQLCDDVKAHTTAVMTLEPSLTHWDSFFKSITCESGGDSFSNIMSLSNRPLINSFYYTFFRKIVRKEITSAAAVSEIDRSKILSKMVSKFAWSFLRTYVKIGGVFIGSDNQGGNDQGQDNSCSFLSTDYTGTIQVAGKSLKVKNLWSSSLPGMQSGDILGFRLVDRVDLDFNSHVEFRLSSNPAIPKNVGVRVTHMKNDNGLPFASPFMLMPCVLGRYVHNESYRLNADVPYFMQFGISNQLSKQVNTRSNELLFCTDATAAIPLMNIEVFLRFNIIKAPGGGMTSDFRRLELPHPTNPNFAKALASVGAGARTHPKNGKSSTLTGHETHAHTSTHTTARGHPVPTTHLPENTDPVRSSTAPTGETPAKGSDVTRQRVARNTSTDNSARQSESDKAKDAA